MRGRLVTLRGPTEEDLPLVNGWMADARVRREGHLWGEPATLATWKERFREAAKDKGVLWTIESDGRAVGLARIDFGDEDALHADVRHLVVDPEVWGRGLGGDAALAVHRFVFDYLDRRGSCVVELAADNARALRVAERLGYREFGRGHDVYYRDGRYADQLWLRLDRETWNERWSATEREYEPLPEGSRE